MNGLLVFILDFKFSKDSNCVRKLDWTPRKYLYKSEV